MDDRNLCTSFVYDADRMPAQYIENRKDNARREFCFSLINWMIEQPDYKNKHFVIQLVEQDEPMHKTPWANMQYVLTARISLAQTQHIEVMAPPDYSSMPFRELSNSALGEIKRRIKKFFTQK